MEIRAVTHCSMLGLKSLKTGRIFTVTGQAQGVLAKELGTLSSVKLTQIPDQIIPHNLLKSMRLVDNKRVPIKILEDGFRNLTRESKVFINDPEKIGWRPTFWDFFSKTMLQCHDFAAKHQSGELAKDRGIVAQLDFQEQVAQPPRVMLAFSLFYYRNPGDDDRLKFMLDLNLEVKDGR